MRVQSAKQLGKHTTSFSDDFLEVCDLSIPEPEQFDETAVASDANLIGIADGQVALRGSAEREEANGFGWGAAFLRGRAAHASVAAAAAVQVLAQRSFTVERCWLCALLGAERAGKPPSGGGPQHIADHLAPFAPAAVAVVSRYATLLYRHHGEQQSLHLFRL